MADQVKSLFDDGFCVSPTGFSAAPFRSYGIRFTVTRHNEAEDIEALVEATMAARARARTATALKRAPAAESAPSFSVPA